MTKKTKRFAVSIPITGSMSIEVDAEHADAAIERAWEAYEEDGAEPFEVTWEATNFVAEGNVCHAELNQEEATEIAPKEDDES